MLSTVISGSESEHFIKNFHSRNSFCDFDLDKLIFSVNLCFFSKTSSWRAKISVSNHSLKEII